MTTSLLAKATAIRVEHCETAEATTGLDIGHTSSATLASISARIIHNSLQDFNIHTTTPHNRFTAFFRNHPSEPVPEQNLWTLWCKGRLTEADTPTIPVSYTHLTLPTIYSV